MTRYFDDWGNHLGFCNDCGEEAPMGSTCCDTGEVVQFDDDEVEF